jgi:hypothetical protein
MDSLTDYRLDQFEKLADAADARMQRVEDKLTEIQITLASLSGSLATKDNVRNWSLTVIGIVVATVLTAGAMMMAASGNEISAFQAGMAALQTVKR